MATDKLIIKVKDDGKMEPSESLQGPGRDKPPVITLPGGGQVRDACIVVTKNPTCAWVQIGGQWQRKCWQS